MHACAIVLDWSWLPIHKLTGLDVWETRWDNATWCNTTPHSYIRMANDGRINIENLFLYLFTLFLRIFWSSNYYEIRIISGMGQTPHLRNWVIGKGVQMKVKQRTADQTEKQGIRSHVACILPVGVLGQNVTGQNVMDTMSRTKYYEDKILLVKMRVILSATFCPEHIVQWHFVHITFGPRHFVRDILSGDILSSHP